MPVRNSVPRLFLRLPSVFPKCRKPCVLWTPRPRLGSLLRDLAQPLSQHLGSRPGAKTLMSTL